VLHGPFGGVGNYSIFEDDREIQIEEGQVYLLGWNLLEGHGTSRNSFLQFSNGSCSPSFSDRIRLFEPEISLDSPFPGYVVSEKLHNGTEVYDTTHALPNEEHIGAAYVTAPLSGKFRPTPIPTHTTNKEFTGCTDPDAVNYNVHAFVDIAVEDCKYICEFTWTPTNYNVTYSAEKAASSSYLPHDILAGAPSRDIMAALDGSMQTSYHSNQGTPSKTNPVEIRYDFVELDDHQAIVQYAISSRCCDSPLAPVDAPKTWTVQGSHDGETWFELSSVQNETGWGSETRMFVIEQPVHCRYVKLAVTDVGGREATRKEGGLYSFLVVSELSFFVGEYLCSAAPHMRGYDVSACAAAVIPDPEHDRNPCAKSTSFVFTKDRVVSEQGTALGLALNYYEVVPCYHPDAVVCSTEQVFIPVAPPLNCSFNAAEEPATCVDQGTVCASGTTGSCPAGCTDDGSECAGTATCELGPGGEEADCPTTDGCTFKPRKEKVDNGMDSYKEIADTSNVSACNETERMVLSRFWSTLQPTEWGQTECLVQRASLAMIEPIVDEDAAVELDNEDEVEASVDKRIMLWESETKTMTVMLHAAPRHPVRVSFVPSSDDDVNRSTTCMDAAFPYSPPAQCDMAWLGSVQDDCESFYCLNCPFAHACDAMCDGYGYSYCDSRFYGG
jgi:hypothetical protein